MVLAIVVLQYPLDHQRNGGVVPLDGHGLPVESLLPSTHGAGQAPAARLRVLELERNGNPVDDACHLRLQAGELTTWSEGDGEVGVLSLGEDAAGTV